MKEYLERKLRHMKPSEQRFINAARQDRIFWRGDDIETFKRIYDETMAMRKIGPQEYRRQAIDKLKRFLVGSLGK